VIPTIRLDGGRTDHNGGYSQVIGMIIVYCAWPLSGSADWSARSAAATRDTIAGEGERLPGFVAAGTAGHDIKIVVALHPFGGIGVSDYERALTRTSAGNQLAGGCSADRMAASAPWRGSWMVRLACWAWQRPVMVPGKGGPAVRFGLDVATSGAFADAGLLAGLAAEAEEAGWDGFFIWDILLGSGDSRTSVPVVDAWVALAAIALRTRRIRLGAFMTPLPRRRPWDVARCVATLDRLSEGRMVFGAGLGYRAEEFAAIGEDPSGRVRAEKLDEGLTIVDGLWRGEPVTVTGRHYQVKDLVILPQPVQRPRVPIWTAAGWPRRRPLQRAARWDGTYLMTLNQETGELLTAAEVAAITSHLAGLRPGADPIDIALNGDLNGDQDPRGTISRFEDAGATWWIELCSDTPEQERDRIRAGPAGRS
jgi:alkanesulfonate monooxygenase SsuD/methylene tetrahydromethanopterin reductase-like flavin-dependent oxidoreductase (luciferase family)